MINFFDIHWAGIHRLFLLPLVITAAALALHRFVRLRSLMARFAGPRYIHQLIKYYSPTRHFFKVCALIGGMILVSIALLRPQWGKKEQQIVQEGRDLLILLDISRSMRVADVRPQRLAFAKLKIRNFLDALSCERVGLVLFSGSAFLQCPLTRDYAALKMFLDQVDIETIASGTTALDTAFFKAMDIFKQSGERKNRLVLLVTDGEDFSADLEPMQRRARETGIKILALGVGTTEGGPVPIIDPRGNQSGVEVDAHGSVALSKLNMPMLSALVTSVGGFAVQATYDDSDITQLVNHLETYEKEQFEEHKFSLYEDQYPWFMAGAWTLFALEWIL